MRFVVLKARVRACVNKAVAWAKRTIREALRPAPIAAGLLCDVFRSRKELLAENALLRQQLLVASRNKKRSCASPHPGRTLTMFRTAGNRPPKLPVSLRSSELGAQEPTARRIPSVRAYG